MNYERTQKVFLTALSNFDMFVRNAPKHKLSKEYWTEAEEIKINTGLYPGGQKWAQKAYDVITGHYLRTILSEARFVYINAETEEVVHNVGDKYEKITPEQLITGYESGKYKGHFVWVGTGKKATEPTGKKDHISHEEK